MTFRILMIKQTTLQIQLVLFFYHISIQNANIDLSKWHSLISCQNETNPSIRKLIFHTSTLISLKYQKPTLPICSTVNTNPNDYPFDTTSVNNGNDSRVKVYSKTNYPFTRLSSYTQVILPPIFSTEHSTAT